MATMNQNTCMTCMHRHEDQCRRFPPQVSSFTVPVNTFQGPGLQVQSIGAFPRADETTWCAEWAGVYKLAS